MIGELMDRVVSWYDPLKGLKRTHARNVLRHVSGQGYESGRPSRSHDKWRPGNRSPDLEMLETADWTRARARDLVRNNAYARGILRAMVRNVVGRGIRLQARVKGKDGKTLNKGFNRAAEKLFTRWSKECDVTGRLNFFEMQRAIVREVCESGECLVHFVSLPQQRGRALPFALELIDADRLASDRLFPRGINADTGNEVRRGVEVDAHGRPVAYHVYDNHPNDITANRWTVKRLPAENVLHLFRQERIGQTRGVSAFSCVVWWLKNLGFYVENEMQASAVASCFSVAVTTIDGGEAGTLAEACGGETSDAAGNQFEHLHPGMVARLLPGETIQTINPQRGAANSSEWINLMLRSMAVGTGLSFERLSRDYSRTNFSSNRASDLEDRREFRIDQDWLTSHFCEPVFLKFLAVAVDAGAEGFPQPEEFLAQYDVWTEHVWLSPGWEWVDPQKEANASQTALEQNLTTLSDELAARGRDLNETLEQRAYEHALIDELGLQPPEPAAGQTPPASFAPNPEDPPDHDVEADEEELELAAV